MKLTLEKDALTHALARAERVVEKRNSIPILGNLLIRAQGDHLFVTGTDLDSAITTRAQAEIAQPGETTLPAGTLIEFAKKLPTGQKVALEQAGDDPRIALRAGRTRLHLPTIPPADFPTFTGAEPLASFELPASQMVSAIERVAFAISTEETRYYLNGIYFHIAEGEKGSRLTAVATDGHRLGLHALTLPEGAASLPPVIIPRKAVDTMARLLRPLDNEAARLAISKTHLTLTAGVTEFSTKLIDGTYPDYTRVIPAGGAHHADLDVAELSAAVDRVITVSSERARAVKFSFGEPTPEALTLTVTNPDTGDATDTLDIAYEGAPIQIGFNGRYVLDILTALQAKRLRFTMTDPGSPTLITPEGRDDSCAVLMPMRV